MSDRSQYPDTVLRISDSMNFHATVGNRGWASYALQDGATDHIAYDTWSDAVKARKWDRDNFMYLEIQPDGMPLHEAAAVVKYFRVIHQLGHRIPSPDWEAGPMTASMPAQSWDRARMAKQLHDGKPLDPRGYTNLPGGLVPSAYKKGGR